MSDYNFLNRDKKKDWQNAEKHQAQRIKGKVQPASGSQIFNKGDVRNLKVLMEVKQTSKDGFRVTKKLLQKIEKESENDNAEGRIPILALDFGKRKYYIIKDSDFELLGGSFE